MAKATDLSHVLISPHYAVTFFPLSGVVISRQFCQGERRTEGVFEEEKRGHRLVSCGPGNGDAAGRSTHARVCQSFPALHLLPNTYSLFISSFLYVPYCFQTSKASEHLGIELNKGVVAAVAAQSSAAKQGMQAGGRIVAINGQPTQGECIIMRIHFLCFYVIMLLFLLFFCAAMQGMQAVGRIVAING
jgi:hypothetical protein